MWRWCLPTLPPEGGVQHAALAQERVAREPFCFQAHVPSGSHRPLFFERGLRRGLDEAPDGRGVRGTVRPIQADGFERVSGEQLAKGPGKRTRASEHLEQREASPDRDDHAAGSFREFFGELPESVEPPGEVGLLLRLGGRGHYAQTGLAIRLPPHAALIAPVTPAAPREVVYGPRLEAPEREVPAVRRPRERPRAVAPTPAPDAGDG